MALASVLQDAAAVLNDPKLTPGQKVDDVAVIYARALHDQIDATASWTLTAANGWTVAFSNVALSGKLVELFGVVAQKDGVLAPVDPHQQFIHWFPLYHDPAGPITVKGERFRLDPLQNAIDVIGEQAERATA